MLKCKEFVNSDEIAKGLSPFNSDSIAVAVEASRIMYKRIKELIASGETFAMETTLATRSGANLIREAQREGYYVTLLYFWLNTPDLAVERVKMRVAAGGHNIPESTIRRRYEAGIHNLFELYIPICDYWMIADNSMSPMEVIAKGFRSDKKEIYKGANIAFQRLVNQKKKEDGELVFSRNGYIFRVKAADLEKGMF